MGRITVRVLARASRDAIEGRDATGRLRVRLTAPPVEGAANAALLDLLARALGVARSRLAVVHGERSRSKTIEIEGVSEEAVWERVARISSSHEDR
jgi:uncharacterized protein (TIGR00251 family)